MNLKECSECVGSSKVCEENSALICFCLGPKHAESRSAIVRITNYLSNYHHEQRVSSPTSFVIFNRDKMETPMETME